MFRWRAYQYECWWWKLDINAVAAVLPCNSRIVKLEAIFSVLLLRWLIYDGAGGGLKKWEEIQKNPLETIMSIGHCPVDTVHNIDTSCSEKYDKNMTVCSLKHITQLCPLSSCYPVHMIYLDIRWFPYVFKTSYVSGLRYLSYIFFSGNFFVQ